MRIIRWIIYIFTAFIFLFLITCAILWFSLDINRFKPNIIEFVKEKTSRTLTLDGDISWNFSGYNLDISIGSGSLSNPEGQKGTFSSWQQANIGITLWPIISYYLGMNDNPTVQIKNITINHATTNITVYPDGHNNLSFKNIANNEPKPKNMNQPVANNKANSELSTPANNSTKGNWKVKLTGEILIENATLNVDNQKNNQQLKLYNANLELSSLEPKITDLNQLKIKLGFNAQFDKIPFDTNLEALALIGQNNILLKSLKGEIIVAEIDKRPQQNLEFQSNQINISNDNLGIDELRLVLNNQLFGILSKANYLYHNQSYSAHLALKGDNLNDIFESLGITLPTLANAQATHLPQLNFDVKGNNENLSLSNIQGSLNQTKYSGNFKLTSFNPISLSYSIDFHPVTLSDYIDLKGGIFTAELIHSNGKLTFTDTQAGKLSIDGSNQISTPKSQFKGIDINNIAVNVQNLLKSIATLENFQSSLNDLKDEILTLNIKGGRINPNNGLVTDINDILISNQFNGTDINTTTIKASSKEFYLNGSGQFNINTKALRYDINAFVFNQNAQNLEDYQKVYIPYIIWRNENDDKVQSNVNFDKLFKQVQPIATKSLSIKLSDQLKNNKKLNEKINQFLNNL